MHKVTSEEQARKVLVDWIRSQGYTEDIMVGVSYGLRYDNRRGNYYDFDVYRPYGVFMVYEDGTIEDNYGVFTKK